MSGSFTPGAEWGRRARRALPLFLLVLALAVTGVGAFYAQRAQRSHRVTAEALLRDYGAFAAWSFSERAAGYLGGSLRSTLPPMRADLFAGDPLPCLERILEAGRRDRAECRCRVSLAGRFAFHAPIGAGPSGLTFAGEAPEDAVARGILEAVAAAARSARADGPVGMVQIPGEEPALLVAYARRVGEAGDTVVYGVEVDQERYRAELRRAADHPELLPPSLTRGAPNTSLLAIQVLAPEGDVLFASVDGEAPGIHADQPLPPSLGGAVVRAAVLPEAADLLIIGGIPGDRTPGLLLLFGLAAALVVLAVSLLRKENELARLRSDFVASVSHELRTPLAQVRLFVETVRLGRTRTPGERDWALDRIDRETLRLTGLVEKILHFSRTERGAVAAERETVDLAEEVRDAVESFRALLRPGVAELRLDLEPGLAAPVHPDSFRQVVLNLLENAVKYGARGQTVRVGAERVGDSVRIAVEDQGPGVPPGERRLVWEPFRRGASTVGSVAVGGGIGLSVVREIVEAHGGRARVEDAAGGGARFVVEFPAPLTVREEQLRHSPPAPVPSRSDAGSAPAGVA